jgi:small subunit ribosomal protein S20
MPTHKSAAKRMRQSEVDRLRNRHYRTTMRNQIKRLRATIDSGDQATAAAQLAEAVSVIQATAQKGVIHRRSAARRVSRLALAVNGLKKD